MTTVPAILYLLCNTRFIQTQIGCHPQLNQANTRKSIQRIRNNTSDETIPSHSYFIQQFRTTLDMSNSSEGQALFFFTNVLVTWIHKKYFSKKNLECKCQIPPLNRLEVLNGVLNFQNLTLAVLISFPQSYQFEPF